MVLKIETAVFPFTLSWNRFSFAPRIFTDCLRNSIKIIKKKHVTADDPCIVKRRDYLPLFCYIYS